MKIAFLIPNDILIQGARYKYFKFFKDIYSDKVKLFRHYSIAFLKAFKPDIVIVFGAFMKSFKYPLRLNIPYVLCDHDISSLYAETAVIYEKIKVTNAAKIIFTSEEHQDYICQKYNYPREKTMVLYLRPSIGDLEFDPLQKLPGLNLVYAGGLLSGNSVKGRYGYRVYIEIFQKFIQYGWKVHLYPAREAPMIYSEIGCIFHPVLPEGLQLYRSMSQYTAGLQSYFNAPDSVSYAFKCRPNKLWNYLAAGIPTIGFNGGNGMKFYIDKWGLELKELEDIPDLGRRLEGIVIYNFRRSEIIESQTKELISFINN